MTLKWKIRNIMGPIGWKSGALAKALNAPTPSVRRALSQMVKAGVLKVEEGVYRLEEGGFAIKQGDYSKPPGDKWVWPTAPWADIEKQEQQVQFTQAVQSQAAQLQSDSLEHHARTVGNPNLVKPIADVDSLKTYILWGDCHIPFENKRHFDLVLKIVQVLKPYGQIIIGDFGDNLALSRHPKTPDQMRWQSTDEDSAVNHRLDQLDAVGSIDKYYFGGNHETNGQRKSMDVAIGLYDSMDPIRRYHLKERGWKYYEYHVPAKVGKVWFVHDTENLGRYSVFNNADAFGASTCQGHTHSAAVAYFGSATGEKHVSMTLGWLGDENAAKYMADIRKRRNWMPAFGLMRIDDKGNSHLQLVPIIEGQCVVDGELYT